MEPVPSHIGKERASSYQETLSHQSSLKWFLFLRLIIAILALVAILIYQQKTFQSFPPRLIAAYITLIFACFINIVYLASFRLTLIHIKRLIALQITIDIFLETLLVYFTGGIRGSIFVYLYFASIMAGAFLISARSSFFFASLASILLSAITITYFVAGHFNSDLPFLTASYTKEMTNELSFILPYLFFFALVLHIIALLSGRLTIELSQERILKGEILQGMTSGLIVVNRQGKIIFHNDQLKELLQLSPNEKLIGNTIEDIFTGFKYAPFRESLLDNGFHTGEITVDTKGKNTFIEFITSALKGARGEIRGSIALLNDISMLRKIDEVTKKAEKWQYLSEMATAIAHEIRNPLASIKSAVQELSVVDKLTTDEKKLMHIVIKESERLNQIITEFLDFTRERPLTFQECNINQLLDEVAILLERRPACAVPTGRQAEASAGRDAARRITIQKEIKKNLTCRADQEQLKQVFLNLGINALEANTDKIIFRAYPDTNNSIVVEVIDFGKGIEVSSLDKIYDPFFTTKPKGVGLGLAVANKIIQLHKGLISVESKSGKSTKFTVWLPCSPR